MKIHNEIEGLRGQNELSIFPLCPVTETCHTASQIQLLLN